MKNLKKYTEKTLNADDDAFDRSDEDVEARLLLKRTNSPQDLRAPLNKATSPEPMIEDVGFNDAN